MNKDKKKGLSPDKEPIPVSPARAGEVRQQHPRANMRPVASAGSTERGGYGYPDLLSWSPVALPSLPSGRERQRHRDRISACALQAREHTAEGQGRTALPLQPAFAKIFQRPQDPCSHPRRLYWHRVVVPKVAGSSPVGHPGSGASHGLRYCNRTAMSWCYGASW